MMNYQMEVIIASMNDFKAKMEGCTDYEMQVRACTPPIPGEFSSVREIKILSRVLHDRMIARRRK